MEVYLEPHERVIATMILLDRDGPTMQSQVRIFEDGEVIYREFQRQGLRSEMIVERQSTIPIGDVFILIEQVSKLMRMSRLTPKSSDFDSRQIALHHKGGEYESIEVQPGVMIGHPTEKAFEAAWQVIQAATEFPKEGEG